MAYTKRTWVTGETITNAKLNNIENGIESNTEDIVTLNNELDLKLNNTGADIYAVTTGTANTYVGVISNITSLVAGFTARINFNVENTETSTINVNGLGAKTVKKVTGVGLVNLAAGDIVANGIYILVYNGTYFVIAGQFKTKPMIHVFTSNGTFTAPFTGYYKVTVVGGGGSGGAVEADTYDVYAGGGGAGGTAIKIVALTKNSETTVTVGANGAQKIYAPYTNLYGNTGGTSSFGSLVSATGGDGGSPGNDNIGYGGDGGNGVDGHLNLKGQRGSNIFESYSSANSDAWTPVASSVGGGLSYGAGSSAMQANPNTDTNGTYDNTAGVVIVEWMEG